MFGNFGKQSVSCRRTISTAGVRSPVEGHASEAAIRDSAMTAAGPNAENGGSAMKQTARRRR